MEKVHHIFRTWRRDRRGAVAIITAILFVPVILYCAGMPIDIARTVQLRSALQNIADNASLAAAEDLENGATGQQACNLADAFVHASASGLSVAYSSLGSTYAGGDSGYAGTNFTTTIAYSPLKNLGCLSTGPHTDSLADIQKTAPYQVVVSISANLPTTFMSFARTSIPVQVSSTSVGASNFISMCISSTAAPSGDYNRLSYYAIDPNGNLYNVGADGATAPAKFSEGTDPATSQFLVDDLGNVGSYGTTSSTCNSNTFYVHLPIDTTIGFAFSSEKGGLVPCVYATSAYQSACPSTYPGISPGGTPYSQSTAVKLSNFYTDAYGSTLFTIIRFYSTDYPASKNTSTTDTLAVGGTVGSYTPTSQYKAATTVSFDASALGKPGANEMYFNSVAGFTQTNNSTPPFIGQAYEPATSDLVCMVSSGSLVTDETLKPYYSNSNGAAYYFTDASFTNTSEQNNVQQENLAVANSAITYTGTNPSTNKTSTFELFQCPTTSSSSPYNVNPTCAELNGATLYGGWNDMGGPADNVAYGDLPFTFSCNSGSVPVDYIRSAISQ